MKALRQLTTRPAFAWTAIFTLALGIGASTAIYAVAWSVLFRPLPYPEADRLVRLRQIGDRGTTMAFSGPNIEDVTAASRSLGAVASHAGGMVAVRGGAEPVRVRHALVSAKFFDVETARYRAIAKQINLQPQ